MTICRITSLDSTNSHGHYNCSQITGMWDYIAKPSKPVDVDIGEHTVITYDAALTAQTAVGIKQLTYYETIAADVNKDGQISTYDAALIAQYAVGLPKPTVSHVGEWKFVPDSISYQPLNSDMANENYIGIIIGNVHGGWTQP